MQRFFKSGRVILALLFFIAILISFSDIKGNLSSKFYDTALYLQFVPSVLKFLTTGATLSIGFLLVLIVTIIGGRVYCSTICPLGILQDIIIFFKRKFTIAQRLRFKKALNILRYSILVLTIISFVIAGVLFLNLLDPYAVFGRMASHIYQPLFLNINNVLAKLLPSLGLNVLEARSIHWASLAFAGGMLLLVGILSVFRGRIYCNSICPVGTFLGLVSKISIFKIKINESSCTKCGKCQAVCKANCINIKTLTIDETRCISCYNCIPVCDDNAVGYRSFLPSKAITQDAKTDSRRRFLLTATVAYFASKAIPVFSQHGHGDKIDFFSKGPTAPPGAQSIEHFKNRCIACHLCVSVCPTKVLQPSFLEYGITGMNLPEMNYGINFCNNECIKCGEVCPTGAIIKLPVEEKKLTQIGKVVLRKDLCIVHSENTACGSCSEHCPTQAVKMRPYPNGLPGPVIDSTICIGCGACEYACPVTDPHPAIFVNPNAVHLLAEKPQTKKVEFEETEEFPF
jgi:ferredoxin